MKNCVRCGVPLKFGTNTKKYCIDCRQIVHHEHQKTTRERAKLQPPKIHNLYQVYKRNAQKRSLDFNITMEEFLGFINTKCHYCGEHISTVRLDRIDNKLGYTIDNIVSCCKVCNFMKHTLSYSEFITKCNQISSKHTMS